MAARIQSFTATSGRPTPEPIDSKLASEAVRILIANDGKAALAFVQRFVVAEASHGGAAALGGA